MPELKIPKEEMACLLYAGGKSQRAAFAEAFAVVSKSNNSSRFFNRDDVKIRIAEIKRRRAVLADLDDVFVLKQLKAIAKQGELLGNINLDDFFHHAADGKRTNLDLTMTPRPKMAALEEVTIEHMDKGSQDDPQIVTRTKIKLKAPTAALAAAKMLGDWLGMWAPQKIAPTDPQGEGPAVIEIRWKDPI